MDVGELIRSATTAIRTNKTRSVLTSLGIIIGVATVIMLVAIGAGLQTYVTKQFTDLGSNLVFVVPGKVNVRSGPGRPVTATPKFSFDDARNLERLGEPIEAVSAGVFKAGTAKFGGKTADVTINGVDEKYGPLRNVKVQVGEFVTRSMVERSQMVVVIGPTVVKNLFGEGANEVALKKTIDISGRKYIVVGISEAKGGAGFGSSSDQDSFVYIPVTTASKVLGEKKPASILVKTTTAEGTTLAATKIKNYFYRRKLTDDDFTVLEPKEILATITSFLGVVTGALSGIAAISLIVGGIGIANIMLVSVTERTREIGLRKALGATSRDIMLQFLVEAVMLSGLGGMIGVGIGGGFALLLRKFIQTTVSPGSVFLAFGVAAAVGVVSGLAPAIRAARLNPIDALRYE